MVEQQTETKGLLNSGTIRNALYLLLTNGVTWVLSHEQQVTESITGLFPIWLQPFVPPFATAVVAALNIWFTGRVITSRKAVGDIQGFYTKNK